MAKFLNAAGLLIETTDADKIECYRAKGLQEVISEPQPEQKDIEVTDDFVVRPAKKKKSTKGTKKGG